MDTFALERIHAMLKETAAHVRNTRDFEESVTCRALNLCKAWFDNYHDDQLVQPMDCADGSIAIEMRLEVTLFGKGDIMFNSTGGGFQIVAAVQAGAGFSFYCHPLHFVEKVCRSLIWIARNWGEQGRGGKKFNE